jgi:hypothetical protein
VDGATANLLNTTLSNNSASHDGGGIFNQGFSGLTLVNTTLHGNHAGRDGGGIHNGIFGSTGIYNSTITGNSAGRYGGGAYIYSGPASLTLTNSIVAGNNAAVVGDEVDGSATFSGVNVVGIGADNDGSDGVKQADSLEDLFQVVVEIDPDETPESGDEFDAGGLADNGGPVETVAIVRFGPAHQFGSNAALPADTFDLDGDDDTVEDLPIDARGKGRVSPLEVDIGAFELQIAPVIADLDTDILAYTEGDGAEIIDQGTAATITDPDSLNYDGGSLTVSIVAGEDAGEDELSIQTSGTLNAGIEVDGSHVLYDGVGMGDITTDGTGGDDLVVAFDEDATLEAVQALIRAVTRRPWAAQQ